MSEGSAEQYLCAWDPAEYLRQYYSTPLTRDDAANTRFAADCLGSAGRRFATALEFGCGPTVHHVLPLAPYVDHVTLADFLPSNLAQVRAWLAEAPEAFDWDLCLDGMLALELDGSPSAAARALPARKQRLRSIVRELVHGDILRPSPLGSDARYDLVASYYCLEALGLDLDGWSRCLGRLGALVAPEGALLLGSVRRASEYTVLGRSFAVTPVDEDDFARELPRHGFVPGSLRIEVAAVPEFATEGFDSVCCVFARKAG